MLRALILMAIGLALIFSACFFRPSTGSVEIIEVGTTQELLAGLGSNRTLVLRGNVFFLSEMADHFQTSDRIGFIKGYVDRELRLKGIRNLTIRGKDGERPVLLTEPQYGNVLVFENCDGIRLQNLTLGHGPSRGFCSGGVLRFSDCANLIVDECLLFGSGTEGIMAERCSVLTVENSRIETCTYDILTLNECSDVTFRKCLFTRNESQVSGLINIEASRQVSFVNCDIRANGTDYTRYLFEVYDSSPVELLRCNITDNVVRALVNNDTALMIRQSTLRDNRPVEGPCCDEP